MRDSGVETFHNQQPTGLPDYEFHRVMDAMEHQLRGHEVEVDAQGHYAWKPVMVEGKPLSPLCNDEGISRMISLLRSYVNSVTALSGIPIEEKSTLFKIMKQFGEDVVEILWFNYEQFGIADPSHLKIIYNIMINPVFFMSFHPFNKNTINALTEMYKQNVVVDGGGGMGMGLPGIGGK